MGNICFFCDFISAGWHWGLAVVMPLLFIAIVGIPVANILHRAGYSRWWAVFAFVPLANLFGLWVFAFARWPKLNRS